MIKLNPEVAKNIRFVVQNAGAHQPHVLLTLRNVEWKLHAGDMIFTPSGWWHCVLNLSRHTVGYSADFINNSNIENVLRQLDAFDPAMARRVRANIDRINKCGDPA